MKPANYTLMALSTAAALFGLASGAAVLGITEARADDKTYCSTAPALPETKIRSLLEQAGYKVEEIEMEDGCMEVEVTDAQGVEREFYLEPSTGRILKDEEDD